MGRLIFKLAFLALVSALAGCGGDFRAIPEKPGAIEAIRMNARTSQKLMLMNPVTQAEALAMATKILILAAAQVENFAKKELMLETFLMRSSFELTTPGKDLIPIRRLTL